MSGWWNKYVVSRYIIRCGCRRSCLMEPRQYILPLAEGDVFELGCGDGINLPLLDARKLRSFCAIDPDPDLLQSAREVAAEQRYPCDIRQGRGEDIPFPSASFDTVLTTFTLCSVQSPEQVFSELRRVLRPGGKILFLEHGLSPDTAVQRCQHRIDPISSRLLGNCHMSREISGSFERAGFQVERMGSHYAQGLPPYAGWLEWGAAHL